MYWCEDMNLVPVLAVYAGFSLDIANYDSGNATDANELPLELMGPILQEALDELEFLTGNTSTYWGGKRAKYGHPKPFEVPFVEIGNEDFFSSDYPTRAKFMLEGMRANYPNIAYIYSAKGNRVRWRHVHVSIGIALIVDYLEIPINPSRGNYSGHPHLL